jgi:hypothetical protein
MCINDATSLLNTGEHVWTNKYTCCEAAKTKEILGEDIFVCITDLPTTEPLIPCNGCVMAETVQARSETFINWEVDNDNPEIKV